MRTIGNILWLLLNGLWMAIVWSFIGALLSITIILLPFGRQCFKLANFALWPFGRSAVPSPNAVAGGVIGNILWFIPGLFLALAYAISGVALCFTIIGIPFGIQSFKFVPLALFPFGKEIVDARDLRDDIGAGRASCLSRRRLVQPDLRGRPAPVESFVFSPERHFVAWRST